MDVMRSEYRELNADEKNFVLTVKRDAQLMLDTINRVPANRELALAKTKLEEAVMWAVKGVTG